MENTCPFQGCSQTYRNTLEAMLHSSLCQFCMVDCPQSCGTKILRKDLASHMTVTCKRQFGCCQFCGALLTWDSLQQHEALCGQIVVSPGESVHSDSKNPQSSGLLDQGCRNETDVCLKEKDEKLLNVYLPHICDSLRDLSLEMSQCKNLLKENLDQIKVRNEFRGESLESPIIQLLQEISSSMKTQSGEKEDLKAWQREMSGLMTVMTQQLETSQASLSQILVNQRSTGSSLAGVQNLTTMLSNKIEDISNQHLVDLGYIRTELEGVKSELPSGPTTTSLGEDHLQGLERDLKNTKEELETVKAGYQVAINELSTMKTELQNTKGEMNTVNSELHVKKNELKAMQIELIHRNEEIEIVKKGVNCKDEKIDSLKKDLQDIKEKLESVKTEQQGTKEELESVKTELQGTKEELATVRTALQTTTTTCCDVKCQELENPVKMADVGLDLTLGVQNWLPHYARYSNWVNVLQKYLYGDGDHRDKLNNVWLFSRYNQTGVFQDRSEEIIRNIDGTEYNVRYKWRVGGEKSEVEVSFHQRGGDVNTLAQYKYSILYTTGITSKSRRTVEYPDLPSAMRPVLHSDILPVPQPPENVIFSDDDSDRREQQWDETNFEAGSLSEPHLLTQGDLNDLVRSRLKGWNLLHKGTKVCFFRKRQDEFQDFFSQENDLVYCNDVVSLMEALGHDHDTEEWRLFIDSSKISMKAVLLHNGNKFPSVPIAHASNMKETYENMKLLLKKIEYERYGWKICSDLKNFVKAMDRNASGFAYLKQKFSSISEAKIKEGIFVGPQIRELQQDGNFQNSLNEVEAAE
ncbi:hypothetical protein LAZ67_7002571 [Cordylochernes scorpioides]|uniref:TRAF-type domain-containing protein n=1 Tax=Cordylochernes scorpioides TaxID=51811 RepID=A0ABY6KRX8_9ARAC|nr:hypothetical protein LAZ67_7002571 [Cordylochernes scorpioides]